MDTPDPSEITATEFARFSKDQVAEFRAILTSEDQPRANAITGPHRLAAETMGKLHSMEPDALFNSLEAAAVAINGGALQGVEGTLASQATTLNALFHVLTQLATEKPRTAEDFAIWFKLALRAQAQSAKALEILGLLKQGPKVVITSQLNAANQQVVNNGTELPKPAKGRDSAPGSNSRPRPRALAQPSSCVPDLLANPNQLAKKYATLD